MAVISDIAGTTNDSFSINGKATIFQGKREPKTILGKNGDIYFQSNGDIFSKKNGLWLKITETIMPVPSQGNHQLIYSNGENYDFTDITYEKLNNNNIITTIPGKVVLPKTPDATASFNNSDEKILEIPNINWINDPEKSLNVVHRTGDEDIGGKKKFTNKFVYFNNDSNYILSNKIDNASSIKLNARNILLELYDEGNNRVWAAIKTPLNVINWCLSHPSNDINATSIACQGWVSNPETSLNVVHRSGDETLTGTKTFTADPIIAKNYPNLFIKNTDVIKGDRVNETKYSQIAYRDKNGKELGYVRHAYYTDNNINESRIELVAVDPDPNHIDDNRIDTFLTLKSTPTTRSATLNFTPDSTPSLISQHIPTIGWINDPEKSLNVVHRTGDESISGTKTFSNVAYGTTPNDDAENKEIITAEWVRKNISGKKLGEMVWSSVPLDDIGLLLMDGRKLKQSEYPEFYDFISNINRTIYPNLVKITSETTSGKISRTNNDYGVFYINTTQKAIWLPDYSKSFALITSENDNNLGSYSKGKVPNITGYHGAYNFNETGGAFYGATDLSENIRGGDWSNNGLRFDASRCSDVYNPIATTVQPESVKVYVYIVVANFASSSSGSINVDELIQKINEFETLLNQKANDSDVVHKTGDETIYNKKIFAGNAEFNNVVYGTTPNDNASSNELVTASWVYSKYNDKIGFPDYTSGISLPNEGSVESDGWIHFKLTWDGSGAIINNVTVCDVKFNSDGTNTEWNIYPVKSGDTYSIWGSGSVTFYPFL